ncbi:MAG: hypothetical protein EBQ86_01920 [Betaproteobacteria bacterium]|jgi:hypothetical protein|nr:hypothetical protein [Betaproteobacteria bacterium]
MKKTAHTNTHSLSGLEGLGQADALESSRIMGVLLSLAGEVFILKAEVKRLQYALKKSNHLNEAELLEVEQSKDFGEWFKQEQQVFGETLMRPFVSPDDVDNVSHLMRNDK